MLPDLPEELLDLIAKELSTENGQPNLHLLVAASLTCRKLYRVMHPWLYKKLFICYPSEQARLLRRTLQQQPQYGKYVLEAVLYAPSDSSENMDPGDGEALEDLATLMLAMQNLRDLWAHGCASDALKPILCNSPVPFHGKLEWVVVRGDTYSTHDLLDLLSFPNLYHAEIFSFHDTRHCTRLLPISFLTSLTSLSLPHSRIGHPLLNFILQQCSSNLEHLRCTIPLRGPRLDLPHDPEVAAAISASPLASLPLVPLSQHLASMKSTLVKLHIETGYQSWGAHEQDYADKNDAQLDLHDFSVLEDVVACSSCFFPSACNRNERLQFYKRLPASLVRLQIDWGFESGIFFLTNPDDLLQKLVVYRFRQHNRLGRQSEMWIIELALHKKACFPNLKEVDFSEVMMSLDQNTCYDLENWAIPSLVKDLFARVDVNLRVHYRLKTILNPALE